MESFPILSKCLTLVSNLSRKLFNHKQTETLLINTDITSKRSLENQSKPKNLKPSQNEHKYKHKSEHTNIKLDKFDKQPRIISFNNFSKSETMTLKQDLHQKNRKVSLISLPKNDKDNLSVNQLSNQNSSKYFPNHIRKIQYFSNGIRKFDTDVVSKIAAGIIAPKQKNKNEENIKQTSKSQLLSQDKNSKKNIKFLKKSQKKSKNNNLINQTDQKLFVNSENYFTYDDGDDISSISWNNETTDDLQPELLHFVRNKFADVKSIKLQKYNYQVNMKKKKGLIQIKVVEEVYDEASKIWIVDENLRVNQDSENQQKNQGNKQKRKRNQLNLSGKVLQPKRKTMHKYLQKQLDQSCLNDKSHSFGSKRQHEISYLNQKESSSEQPFSINVMDVEKHKQPELELEFMAEEEQHKQVSDEDFQN